MIYIHIYAKDDGTLFTMDGLVAKSYNEAVNALADQWHKIAYKTCYMKTYMIDGTEVEETDMESEAYAIANGEAHYGGEFGHNDMSAGRTL